jgi:hypothetical protein
VLRTPELSAVEAGKSQDEDTFRRIPQLSERVTIDVLMTLGRFEDHHLAAKEEKLLSRVFSGLNGTASRRRLELDGASAELYRGLLQHVGELRSFQLHSDDAARKIAHHLRGVAYGLTVTNAELKTLKESLHEIEVKVAAFQDRLSALELRQAAAQALDSIEAHWAGGWWATQSPLERLFLFFDCLSSSPFGDYVRSGGVGAAVIQQTARDRACRLLLSELGATRENLLPMDLWLPQECRGHALTQPIIYLAETSDSRFVMRRSIVNQGQLDEVRAPNHLSILRAVQRICQEALVVEEVV